MSHYIYFEGDPGVIHASDVQASDFTLCGKGFDSKLENPALGNRQTSPDKKLTCHQCTKVVEYYSDIASRQEKDSA